MPRAPRLRLDAAGAGPGEIWLGFGPGDDPAELNLSPTGDLAEAAANLFAHLRAADALAARAGAPPHRRRADPARRASALAINDRLARAAAPEDPERLRLRGAQARPPSADSSRGSIEIERSAAPHFSASLGAEDQVGVAPARSASRSPGSPPSSWPGPQPA